MTKLEHLRAALAMLGAVEHHLDLAREPPRDREVDGVLDDVDKGTGRVRSLLEGYVRGREEERKGST